MARVATKTQQKHTSANQLTKKLPGASYKEAIQAIEQLENILPDSSLRDLTNLVVTAASSKDNSNAPLKEVVEQTIQIANKLGANSANDLIVVVQASGSLGDVLKVSGKPDPQEQPNETTPPAQELTPVTPTASPTEVPAVPTAPLTAEPISISTDPDATSTAEPTMPGNDPGLLTNVLSQFQNFTSMFSFLTIKTGAPSSDPAQTTSLAGYNDNYQNVTTDLTDLREKFTQNAIDGYNELKDKCLGKWMGFYLMNHELENNDCSKNKNNQEDFLQAYVEITKTCLGQTSVIKGCDTTNIASLSLDKEDAKNLFWACRRIWSGNSNTISKICGDSNSKNQEMAMEIIRKEYNSSIEFSKNSNDHFSNCLFKSFSSVAEITKDCPELCGNNSTTITTSCKNIFLE